MTSPNGQSFSERTHDSDLDCAPAEGIPRQRAQRNPVTASSALAHTYFRSCLVWISSLALSCMDFGVQEIPVHAGASAFRGFLLLSPPRLGAPLSALKKFRCIESPRLPVRVGTTANMAAYTKFRSASVGGIPDGGALVALKEFRSARFGMGNAAAYSKFRSWAGLRTRKSGRRLKLAAPAGAHKELRSCAEPLIPGLHTNFRHVEASLAHRDFRFDSTPRTEKSGAAMGMPSG